MGQNKQTPCQRCSAPAYGSVCRHCSLADLRSRKQAKGVVKFVNSVGEFNASGGFQAESGIAFPKVIQPKESGWIGKGREEFQAWCLANRNRMLRGTGGNWRPEAASQMWTF